MKVLMVEPGKSPYETEIEGGLESLQAAIGGDIQATYPFEDPVGVICNDEGKLIGLPLNRAIYDDEGHLYDIVPGNFLLVGLGEEDFTDLPADLMEKGDFAAMVIAGLITILPVALGVLLIMSLAGWLFLR